NLDYQTRDIVALVARVVIEERSVDFYVTHLYMSRGDDSLRLFQVQQLLQWIDSRADGTPAIVCGDFNATLDASSAGLMATDFARPKLRRRPSPRSLMGTARSHILTGRGWTVASITFGLRTASRPSRARSASIARARTIRRCGRPTMQVSGPTCGYEKVFPEFRLGLWSDAMTLPQLMPFFSAAANFAAGNDTPREFFERCLSHVEEFEPAVGAFVCHDIAAARAAADRSTARWRDGRPLSPIDGMPLGIKDIIETADMPTEQGSPLFVGCRTGRDAASVAALREAGAVILGKVVTTEFAATEPRGTRNPWDRERTPGGSSSGSAAAVACGMVPAALGTQVVGSILRPASFCGCVGFKPSVGRINRGGSYDYFSQSCT